MVTNEFASIYMKNLLKKRNSCRQTQILSWEWNESHIPRKPHPASRGTVVFKMVAKVSGYIISPLENVKKKKTLA